MSYAIQMIHINITNFILTSYLEKDHTMIKTRHFINVVIFFQTKLKVYLKKIGFVTLPVLHTYSFSVKKFNMIFFVITSKNKLSFWRKKFVFMCHNAKGNIKEKQKTPVRVTHLLLYRYLPLICLLVFTPQYSHNKLLQLPLTWIRFSSYLSCSRKS